jgi:hypothetical protein
MAESRRFILGMPADENSKTPTHEPRITRASLSAKSGFAWWFMTQVGVPRHTLPPAIRGCGGRCRSHDPHQMFLQPARLSPAQFTAPQVMLQLRESISDGGKRVLNSFCLRE